MPLQSRHRTSSSLQPAQMHPRRFSSLIRNCQSCLMRLRLQIRSHQQSRALLCSRSSKSRSRGSPCPGATSTTGSCSMINCKQRPVISPGG
jgi:hypothetical protein